jgi:hypothetical protein
MKNSLQILAASGLLCFSLSSAQGGAGVITLALPPAGDGYSSLQTGAAIPSGVASAWYNPALITGLKQAKGSTVSFLTSDENWFLPHSRLVHQGVAVSFDAWEQELGLALYRTNFEFGGYPPDSTWLQESVYGLALGSSLNAYLDAGLTIKYFHSDFLTATASGWAFDFGFASSHRARLIDELQSLEVTPSVASVIQNLGADVSYADPFLTDPLPRTWRNAVGLSVDFADVLRITAGHDWDREVHSRSEWSEPWRRTYGVHASFLALNYGYAWLKDRGGERDEQHRVTELEFDLARVRRVVHRMATRDFTSPSEKLNVSSAISGAPKFLQGANVRLVFGKREIESGIRHGQDAWYFSLAL